MKLYKTGLPHLILTVSIYAVAMGFLESAVVVYLRKIYYPGGFNFPLAPLDQQIAITEILREAATLIMLLAIGILAGKSLISRFAWFIYSFAVWDIFYYVFLKLLIGWPESIHTYDILFLIPVTWVGPVIAPVIVSLSMIGFALVILYFDNKEIIITFSRLEWYVLTIGSLLLVTAFTWDYSKYILDHYTFEEIWTLPDRQAIFDTAAKYIPDKFNWFLFILGELIILSGVGSFWLRNMKIASDGKDK